MYGNTTKSAHYLPRTGSYSTVPHRNGRVDVLPPEAREAEIRHLECVEQVRLIKAELNQKRHSISNIKKKMEQRLPFAEFQKLEAQRAAIAARIFELEKQLKLLHADARQHSAVSFERTFVSVAKDRLSKEAYVAIMDDAHALLREAGRARASMTPRTAPKTSVLKTVRARKVPLTDILHWLGKQQTRLQKSKETADQFGRDIAGLNQDFMACTALISMITRMIQHEGIEEILCGSAMDKMRTASKSSPSD